MARVAGAAVLGGLLAAVSPVAPVLASAETDSVHFVAAGDYGSSGNAKAVLSGMSEQQPDLALALGDLSYGEPGAEQEWCDLVTSQVGSDLPFELISGNHESNGRDGDIGDFADCLPNRLPGLVGSYGRQWWVDVPQQDPKVRFVMISPGLTYPDGAWSYDKGSARYEWTADAIDGARAEGVPWVVVGIHKPCLSMGEHGCDGGPDIMNLLISKKVDLVLHGHEHGYQRSKQLALSGDCDAVQPGTFDGDCVVDSDDDLTKGRGTVFATAGTGGVPLRDMDTSDSEARYFRSWSGSNAEPTYGMLDVRATDDTLDARFVRAAGESFGDSFTIRRTTSQPAPFAADAFDRTEEDGWGTADVGGRWAEIGTGSSFAVEPGAATLALKRPSSQLAAYLPSAESTSSDVRATLASDKEATGMGLYAQVVGRRIGPDTEYRARVRLREDGSVAISTLALDGSAVPQTISGEKELDGVTYAPGMRLKTRLQVTGTDPTTVRLKVWPATASEPSGWQLSDTDSTPALQEAGTVGFVGYLSRLATNAPVTMSVSDFSARRVAP